MENGYLALEWPRDGIYVRTFVHEVMNYRYHWHPDLYELNITLCGLQEYCRGSEPHVLEAGDAVLTNPGTGHASISKEANTMALVVQFSPLAFKPFLKKGEMFDFPACRSSFVDRNSEPYRQLRRYAALIYLNATSGSPYGNLAAKGAALLMLSMMCTAFSPRTVPSAPEDEELRRLTGMMVSYIEENYREKLTLQDLADYCSYNRTYVSTLFRNTVGVNFHDYLMRVRFQHALLDLAGTDKNLTDIAMDNGFSDLKSMNAVFREILQRTPAEYRAELVPERVYPANSVGDDYRRYVAPDSPFVRARLQSFL